VVCGIASWYDRRGEGAGNATSIKAQDGLLMAEDKVLFALREERCFIKLVGEAKYSTTAGFDTFINNLFERGDIRDVLVDLTDTSYIDSTSLGELTKIASFLMQSKHRRPTLISTRESINSTIEGLGLDRVFVVVHDTVGAVGREVEMREIPETDKGERENARRILEAHRCLMSLNEKTGRIFRNVVDAFERELGEGGGPSTAGPSSSRN
jgi:anti-anti-sigma factor